MDRNTFSTAILALAISGCTALGPLDSMQATEDLQDLQKQWGGESLIVVNVNVGIDQGGGGSFGMVPIDSGIVFGGYGGAYLFSDGEGDGCDPLHDFQCIDNDLANTALFSCCYRANKYIADSFGFVGGLMSGYFISETFSVHPYAGVIVTRAQYFEERTYRSGDTWTVKTGESEYEVGVDYGISFGFLANKDTNFWIGATYGLTEIEETRSPYLGLSFGRAY